MKFKRVARGSIRGLASRLSGRIFSWEIWDGYEPFRERLTRELNSVREIFDDSLLPVGNFEIAGRSAITGGTARLIGGWIAGIESPLKKSQQRAEAWFSNDAAI